MEKRGLSRDPDRDTRDTQGENTDTPAATHTSSKSEHTSSKSEHTSSRSERAQGVKNTRADIDFLTERVKILLDEKAGLTVESSVSAAEIQALKDSLTRNKALLAQKVCVGGCGCGCGCG